MKKNRFIFAGTLLLALMLSITSCNSSSVGLFYSLENVEKIEEEGRGLEADSPIKSFTLFNSHYFLTTSSLKIRSQGADSEGDSGYSWKNVAMPDGYPVALKVVSDGSLLYVHAANDSSEGMETAVFSSSSINYDNAASTPGWEDITPALAANQRISNIFEVNGQIILERRELVDSTSRYHLVLSGGTALSTVDSQLPYLDAAYDGTNYWFITINSIHSSDGSLATWNSVDLAVDPFVDGEGNPLIPEDSSSSLNVYNFSSINRGFASDLILTSSWGYIYHHETSTWSVFKAGGSDAFRFEDPNGNITRFSSALAVPSSFTGEALIFAGSQNEGYVYLDTTEQTVRYFDPQNLESTNLFYTDLYNGHIVDFTYDALENLLFVLTPRNSLWRGSYADGRLIWVQE